MNCRRLMHPPLGLKTCDRTDSICPFEEARSVKCQKAYAQSCVQVAQTLKSSVTARRPKAYLSNNSPIRKHGHMYRLAFLLLAWGFATTARTVYGTITCINSPR